MLKVILDFAKEEMMIKQVVAHIYVDNLKSIRIIERFGFVFTREIEICLFRNKEYLHNIYTLD